MTINELITLIRSISDKNAMKTILLIDNDPVSTIRISELVQQASHRVLHSHVPEQGKHLLHREKPDLVIYHVPQNGQDTRYAMNSAYEAFRGQGIPLLCITRGHNLPLAAPEILGPKQYLADPFTPYELLRAVEDYFKKGISERSKPKHSSSQEGEIKVG